MDALIKTQEARAWANGGAELAKIFGISQNAVSQWGEHLPEKRALQLRLKKPAWFFANGNLRPLPKGHLGAADARSTRWK